MECFANDKGHGSGAEDGEEEEEEEDECPSRDDPYPPPAPPPPPPETYRKGNFKVGTLSLQALQRDTGGKKGGMAGTSANSPATAKTRRHLQQQFQRRRRNVGMMGTFGGGSSRKRNKNNRQAALSRVNSTTSAKSATSVQSAQTGISNLTSTTSWRERGFLTRYPAFDGYDGDELLEGDHEIPDGLRFLGEREMSSLGARIPALRRRGAKTNTIRQHYYPEGGWGWVVVGCALFVNVLCSGAQLSCALLLVHANEHFRGKHSYEDLVWVGSLSLATSLFTAPFVVGLCRRKSTRLTAVIGGLVMALACLFTSFAQQIHQIFFSYGIMLGVGVGLSRETAGLMLGQYFKRRREFVEAIAQSGSGIGITIFSHFFYKVVGDIGWRLGLQAFTGMAFLCFILGIFYRSASLYHPQRRAILHLKSQKRKVKDTKKHIIEKPPYCDFSSLKSKTVQILMVSNALCGFGIYSPLFHLARNGMDQKIPKNSVVLLYTYCGLAYVVGCIGTGMMVVRRSQQCMISRQYLHQAIVFALGLVLLALCLIRDYHGYALFMWLYGLFLGANAYSLRVYAYEQARARNFARAIAFIQSVAVIPVLIGIPITGYINASLEMSGYYFSCSCVLLSGMSLFALNYVHYEEEDPSSPEGRKSLMDPDQGNKKKASNNNGRAENPENGGPVCLCPASLHKMDPSKQYRRESDGSALKGEFLESIAEENGQAHEVQYPGEFDFDYAASCNKVTDFLLYNDFDERYSSSAGPGGPCSTQSHPGILTLPRQPKPTGSSLHNNLSYSEPEALARIGQTIAAAEAAAQAAIPLELAQQLSSSQHMLHSSQNFTRPSMMTSSASAGPAGILVRTTSGSFVPKGKGGGQGKMSGSGEGSLGVDVTNIGGMQAGTIIQHAAPQGFVREMTTTV